MTQSYLFSGRMYVHQLSFLIFQVSLSLFFPSSFSFSLPRSLSFSLPLSLSFSLSVSLPIYLSLTLSLSLYFSVSLLFLYVYTYLSLSLCLSTSQFHCFFSHFLNFIITVNLCNCIFFLSHICILDSYKTLQQSIF